VLSATRAKIMNKTKNDIGAQTMKLIISNIYNIESGGIDRSKKILIANAKLLLPIYKKENNKRAAKFMRSML